MDATGKFSCDEQYDYICGHECADGGSTVLSGDDDAVRESGGQGMITRGGFGE